jgi:Flp pilus assembly protein TadG
MRRCDTAGENQTDMTLRHVPARTPSSRRAHHGAWRATRGQSLVEFALVFPLFIIALLATIEFAFALNAVLAVDFASRDAALAAAEAGSGNGADCSILKAVDSNVTAPASESSITEVRIFKSDGNGKALGPADVYDVTGAAACAGMPYHLVSETYPETDRCNELGGCTVQTTVDTIGVQITYAYQWKTPLHGILPLAGTGYQITRSNAMRMEPIL